MFVLIQLPATGDVRLHASPGIILKDDSVTADPGTRLVALDGGRSERMQTSILVSLSQLAPEDSLKDPAGLLDRRQDLRNVFWEAYGNLLREIVATS